MNQKLIKTSNYIFDSYLPSKNFFQYRNNLTEKELERDLFYYNRELIELIVGEDWHHIKFPIFISKISNGESVEHELEYLMQIDYSDFHGAVSVNEDEKMTDKLSHVMLELQDSEEFQDILFKEVEQIISESRN